MGHPYIRDNETVGTLTSNWSFHQPSADPKTGQANPVIHDYEDYLRTRTVYGTKRVEPSESIRFGRPTPPTFPVELLTSYHFQREDYNARQELNKSISRSASRQKQFIPPQATRASTGHHKVAPPEPKELWKMKQFKEVEGRIHQIPIRYAPQQSPTFNLDAGRFPIVRAGMPEGLGAYQHPALLHGHAALPLSPTKRITGFSAAPSADQKEQNQ